MRSTNTVFAVLSVLFVCVSLPASAAVSIHTFSGNPPFGGFAPTIDPNAALGTPDGVGAQIPIGGFISFLDSDTFNVVDRDVEFLGTTGPGTVRFYVGQSNGASFSALNSEFFTIPNTGGAFNFSSAALSTYCTGLGGCDVFVIQAWTGTTLALDSGIASRVIASNPEPSSWILMVSGFFFVAFRMKKLRETAMVLREKRDQFDHLVPLTGLNASYQPVFAHNSAN